MTHGVVSHERSGKFQRPEPPFRQPRYYNSHVWSERKRAEKLKYTHRNPVRRGLVSSFLKSSGFRITGGAGRAPEEWILGPGGGTKGGTFVDITATNGRTTIRIQTQTTLMDGKTPTPGERAAEGRIRQAFPNDTLWTIPK
jgi:hypothetical protein